MYTQGEWIINAKDRSIRNKNKDVVICWLSENSDAQDNARLIIAAPDLLKACEYVVGQMKAIKGKAFPLIPVLQAIAKAKGK